MSGTLHPSASALQEHFSLRLNGELGELRKVQQWLAEIEAEWRVPESVAFSLGLCAEEALANIVMYAQPSGREGCIALRLERMADAFVLSIRDDGRSFDPTLAPEPPEYPSLDQAKPGNMGIHLMRSFATGMHYRRDEEQNLLTLTFAAEPAA
jgi:serine/threonine-protein kinase RsbW